MSNIEIGLIGLGILLVLLALRMPVATSMMLVGFVGHWAISPRGAVPSLAAHAFETTTIEALHLHAMLGSEPAETVKIGGPPVWIEADKGYRDIRRLAREELEGLLKNPKRSARVSLLEQADHRQVRGGAAGIGDDGS